MAASSTSVGSASNAGEYGLETEIRRAKILEINLDGSGERIFASGLRKLRSAWLFIMPLAFPNVIAAAPLSVRRGSWNRSRFSGYKVVYVPFLNGKPAGPAEDFLTGFMANPETGEAHGRPVGVAVMADGSLLVADDAGNTVWRVQAGR